jgi:hypothetical protein
MVKPKIITKEKKGGYGPNEILKQARITSKASDICHTKVSMTIRRDRTECLRSPSTYS